MKPLWLVPLFRRKSSESSEAGASANAPANGVASRDQSPHDATVKEFKSNGARGMPRPALRWVGPAGRIALRPFDFEADAGAVCDFQNETYSLNFPDFHYDAAFAAAFRHDLRRASLDGQHGLFVLDEGRLIGFLWLVICQNTWTNERYGYVNNLYVLQERRGLGLGRELMRHSDDFFRSRGVKVARLSVTASNSAACALYANAGYTTERWEMEKKL